jgi:glyoxylate/hydroxypyruvate reductase A
MRVLICSPLEEDLVRRIRCAHPSVEVDFRPDLLPVRRYPCDHTGKARQLGPEEEAQWSRLLASADACFDFDWRDPASMAQSCPRLAWVQATSAGIGGFLERTGLRGSRIRFTTAAGVHAQALAEFAALGILHFLKDVPGLRRLQAERRWERHAVGSVAERRALVVGLGRIGRRVAEVLAAMGAEVWGAGRPGQAYDLPVATRIGDTANLAPLLRETDTLVLCCPLTPQTKGLIGARELELLGREGILVNLARGAVVDEVALVGALQRHDLAGACLDVFSVEPLPPESPLWGMDHVLISPHSASTLRSENAALTGLFIENLGRFLAGRPLLNEFDPDRGY